jgi:hypothetical protein
LIFFVFNGLDGVLGSRRATLAVFAKTFAHLTREKWRVSAAWVDVEP